MIPWNVLHAHCNNQYVSRYFIFNRLKIYDYCYYHFRSSIKLELGRRIDKRCHNRHPMATDHGSRCVAPYYAIIAKLLCIHCYIAIQFKCHIPMECSFISFVFTQCEFPVHNPNSRSNEDCCCMMLMILQFFGELAIVQLQPLRYTRQHSWIVNPLSFDLHFHR